MQLHRLQAKLRSLAEIAEKYAPDEVESPGIVEDVNLHGFSEASLTLSVFKTGMPKQFASQQAIFMNLLGTRVCPRILAVIGDGYCMEYLSPACITSETPRLVEHLLEEYVWCRIDIPIMPDMQLWREGLKGTVNTIPDAMIDKPCLIHGDPTLDNCLRTKQGRLIITDPIPTQWLKRPSIRAVDHGKILQSILGWEVALRGYALTTYDWPEFMKQEDTAHLAVFWCMVALYRIYLRSKGSRPGLWAQHIARELETCIS